MFDVRPWVLRGCLGMMICVWLGLIWFKPEKASHDMVQSLLLIFSVMFTLTFVIFLADLIKRPER
jgi:hypothetical protein